MASRHFCFDGNCGGNDCNEEVLHWVLDQGGRDAGVLAIVMAVVEIVAMDIAMEGIQSMVNETADEENKWMVWQNKRGNNKTLLASFFSVVMYRYNVLAAASIAAIAAQRWQAAGPKFPTIHPPRIFQWLLCKHVRGGMKQQVVAKEFSRGGSARQRPW